MNPAVEKALARSERWRAEIAALREIILPLGLDESVKWGWPCYALAGGNVVLLHGFKDYCAILFFKGALVDDPGGDLIRQSDNVQAARQMRFTSLAEVQARRRAVETLVRQAIAVEQSGARVAMKRTADFAMADELRDKLDSDPDFQAAFDALTPGRQRAYILHISQAKQPATRLARLAKCEPRILAGKGLMDERSPASARGS